jgi:vacuolar protein sorting-associated protein 3
MGYDDLSSCSILHTNSCVLIDGNLYIGTSAGEILHHVSLPPESPNEPQSFILASRQSPPINQPGELGIQQILLLPSVGKACIISNNTLSFYTLPELSPAFPRLSKPLNCGWVGGVDLDANYDEPSDGVVVMLCLRNKIRLVKITNEPLRLRDIEFGGCLSIVRRGDIACVADSRSYALLDVVNQRKIPLFTISSVDDHPAESAGTLSDEIQSTDSGSVSRNLSPADPLRNTLQDERGHRKTSSLNIFRRDADNLSQDSLRPGAQRYGFDSPAARRSNTRRVSTTDIHSTAGPKRDTGKPLPPPPQDITDSRTGSPVPQRITTPLKPLVASPSSQLFLLVTGTSTKEPSVGMFVNLDGDVDRGTIEFPNYPEAIVVDGRGYDITSSFTPDDFAEEGYVLAVVQRSTSNGLKQDVEIQRWDVNTGEGNASKEWLNLSHLWSDNDSTNTNTINLRALERKAQFTLPEIENKLVMKPLEFAIDNRKAVTPNPQREKEESQFVQRLCQVDARITLWHGTSVLWVLRNPSIMKLDSRLRLAQSTSLDPKAPIIPQREFIEVVFNETRGTRSPKELDLFSHRYIRQKSALLLFIDLVLRTISGTFVFEDDKRFTEQALAESELDPRIIIAFLPDISAEIEHSKDGIWVQNGIKEVFEAFFTQNNLSDLIKTDPNGPYGDNLFLVVKRFLIFWRRNKENPSVVDGQHVFASVDAALLHILLLLDKSSPPGPASPGSHRAELYAVVDNGVDCFDRAVELLEKFNRLYVLSRLYGKRKLYSKVLSTWKRIIEGTDDIKSEFADGEIEVRKYLSKLRDRNLVIEYGTWLANRDPKLGVQVFADETSKVVIPTSEALEILRDKSPNAVKHYLEYLVFGKKV